MTNVGLVGPGAPWVPRRRHGWRGPATRSPPSTSTSTSTSQKAVSLAADGIKPAATISDAATDADVLVLMVATAGQAESVLYGDGRGRAVSSSAEYTSPSPAKPSPTPRRSAWTPAPPGKSSGTAPQPPSCSRTAAPGWSTTPNNDTKAAVVPFPVKIVPGPVVRVPLVSRASMSLSGILSAQNLETRLLPHKLLAPPVPARVKGWKMSRPLLDSPGGSDGR